MEAVTGELVMNGWKNHLPWMVSLAVWIVASAIAYGRLLDETAVNTREIAAMKADRAMFESDTRAFRESVLVKLSRIETLLGAKSP